MSHPRSTSTSRERLEVSRRVDPPSAVVRPVPAGVVASALDGDDDERAAALEQLARSARDPHAFAWFWVAASACDDAAFAHLVSLVPPGVQLLPRAVLLVADDLARPSCPRRAPSHAALLGRLDPEHPGSHDAATLIATAPGCDPRVLAAALALLAAAGHPSRAALLRAVVRAVAEDPGAADYAATVAVSLLPPVDEEEAALVERWTAAAGSGAAAAAQPSGQASGQPSSRRFSVGSLRTSLRARARRGGPGTGR